MKTKKMKQAPEPSGLLATFNSSEVVLSDGAPKKSIEKKPRNFELFFSQIREEDEESEKSKVIDLRYYLDSHVG